MGVSGFFDRSADEAARRRGVGPRFRDTDPRPLPDEGGLGLAALIPTEGRIGDSRRALADAERHHLARAVEKVFLCTYHDALKYAGELIDELKR